MAGPAQQDGSHSNEAGARGFTRRKFVAATGTGVAAGAALLGLQACGGSSQAPKGSTFETYIKGSPKRGGSIRVGWLGNGSSETLDPNQTYANIDLARSAQVYERLFAPDPKNQTPVPQLAVNATPDAKGQVWTIELVRDAMWHDGKPFTADDVVYSLTYIANPKMAAFGASLLAGVSRSGVTKVDQHTLKVTLDEPNFFFVENLANPYLPIFQAGLTAKELGEQAVGTGPYKLEGFVAGQTAQYVRNDEYRESEIPYLDSLEILSISDPAARVNSILGGQSDVVAEVQPSLYSHVSGASGVNVLESQSGLMSCFFMQTQTPPFDDVRVRQAMRLLVDRRQIVEVVYGGHARIGNDNPAWFDPNYAEFPQREYDPEKAKSLLKAAGAEGLKVQLATAETTVGLDDMTTLFAEQAKAGGVTIEAVNFTTEDYFTRGWTNYSMGTTSWYSYPVTQQIVQSLVKGAPFAETQWENPKFEALWKAACSTSDAAKRKDLLAEAQKVLYDEGGYIAPAFVNNIEAATSSVGGVGTGVGYPLRLADFKQTVVKSS